MYVIIQIKLILFFTWGMGVLLVLKLLFELHRYVDKVFFLPIRQIWEEGDERRIILCKITKSPVLAEVL